MATYNGGGSNSNVGTSAPRASSGGASGTGLSTRSTETQRNGGTLGSRVASVGTIIPIQLDAETNQVGTSTSVTITQGYFSNGAGLLEGNNIHTGTLADSNEKYYFNVVNTHPLSSSAEVQFSVAYAHRGGSGSDVRAGNETKTVKGESEAVYGQFASLLLPENEISGGFKISQTGGDNKILATNATDEFIYLLVTNREKFKDKLDNKSWTIKLKGANSTGTGETGVLSLTDDSDSTVSPNSFGSIVGPRYNIVSGAAGVVSGSAIDRVYGHFYPHMGVMVFSGAELSASIPGRVGTEHITASFSANSSDTTFISSSGFAPNLNDGGDAQNGVRFVNCLRTIGDEDIRLRGSVEQDKRSYFCTVGPRQCNFTNNPTFISASADGSNALRHKSMRGNPNVYITGIGLHSADGSLLAVAKLSTPIQKNFGTQQTIKVNLTY